MASNEDDQFVTDQDIGTNLKDVKSIPDDVDEAEINEAVRNDPEIQKDLTDGIDKSNVIKETTRGAKPEGGSYKEPSDDVSDLMK